MFNVFVFVDLLFSSFAKSIQQFQICSLQFIVYDDKAAVHFTK